MNVDESINTSHWISASEGYSQDVVRCAKCHGEAKYRSKYTSIHHNNTDVEMDMYFYNEERKYELTPYCPYCGAKMK